MKTVMYQEITKFMFYLWQIYKRTKKLYFKVLLLYKKYFKECKKFKSWQIFV